MYLMMQLAESSNKKLKMLNARHVLSVLTITMTATEYILTHMDNQAKETLLSQCLADNKFDIAKNLLNFMKITPTLLNSQIKLGATTAVEFLIKEKAPWESDHNGWSPLHFAASENKCEIACLLLDYGFDINCLTGFGNNALSIGLFKLEKKLDKNMIKVLFDKGVDLHHKNKNGKSALDYLRDWFNPTDLPFIMEICDCKLSAELQKKLSNETTCRIAIQQQLTDAQTALSNEITDKSTIKQTLSDVITEKFVIQQQLTEARTALSNETTFRIAIQQQLTGAQIALSTEKENNDTLGAKLDSIKKHADELTDKVIIQQQLIEAQDDAQTALSAEKEKYAALEAKLDKIKKHANGL